VVTEWLDLLVRKPVAPAPTDRKLKLREMVERYEGQEVRRLSGGTLEQYVTALSARWGQAVEDGFIGESIPNPFRGRKIPQAPRPENKTHFTRAELQAIFSVPIFTQADRPVRGKGEASYWMPLLLLFTGARPEEVAQLMVGDIFQDPESGLWVLRITDEGKHPYKGQRMLKTSGTFSGRRTFPLHPELLRLRFLAYVEDVRSSGETALFPKLRTKGLRGYLHSQWATWWGEYLRAHNVLPPVGNEARKPVREFRDVWATAARQCRLPRETMEYIMGHTPPRATSNERYGRKGPLGEQISTLRFDGLNLSQVRPWGEKAGAERSDV
jgi:integrase